MGLSERLDRMFDLLGKGFTPLFAFFVFCFILVVILRKRKDWFARTVFAVTLVMFIIICAIRSYGFADSATFHDDYYNPRPQRFEFGYVLFRDICRAIFGPNHQLFFGFIVLLNLAIVMISAKKLGRDVKVFTLFYIVIVGYISNYITIRQSLAISFILLSIAFYFGGRVKASKLFSVLFIAIAVSFHFAAIVLIPFYIMSFLKIPKNPKFHYVIMVFLILSLYMNLYSHIYSLLIQIGGVFGFHRLDVYLVPNDGSLHFTSFIFPLVMLAMLLLIKPREGSDKLSVSSFSILYIMLAGYIFFSMMQVYNRFFFYACAFLIYPLTVQDEKATEFKRNYFINSIIMIILFLYYVEQSFSTQYSNLLT